MVVVSKSIQSKVPYLIRIVRAFPIHFNGYGTYLLFRKYEAFGHSRVIFPNKRGLISDKAEYFNSEFEALAREKHIALEFLRSIQIILTMNLML